MSQLSPLCSVQTFSVINKEILQKNPRFIIKSGFKSREGYNGACTVKRFYKDFLHFFYMHQVILKYYEKISNATTSDQYDISIWSKLQRSLKIYWFSFTFLLSAFVSAFKIPVDIFWKYNFLLDFPPYALIACGNFVL